MKKIIKITALLAVITLAFSGCTTGSSQYELKNRLIIQGIGIDFDSMGVEVTVQVLNTDVSSNPNSGSGPENIVKYYCVSGSSVSQALIKLTEMTGKRPLLSQNRIVVFGKTVAEKGILPYLDDFLRNPENRQNVVIATSENQASDIINADLGENIIPARRIEQIIEAADMNINIENVQVYQFVNMIARDSSSAVMPLLKTEKDGENDVISVCGTAVYSGDSLNFTVGDEITSGILWINNDINKGRFSVRTADLTNATFDIINNDTCVKAYVRDGEPYFIIDVKCTLDLSELGDSLFNRKSVEDFNEMSGLAEREIKSRIENSLNKCIIENTADVFGLGERLKKAEPQYYRNYVANNPQTMKQARFEINVSARIRRTGDSAAALSG